MVQENFDDPNRNEFSKNAFSWSFSIILQNFKQAMTKYRL